MPLPIDPAEAWPPESARREYLKFREWSAWYSGDPMRLRDHYALQVQPTYQSSPWSKFWSRIGSRPATQKAQFHVPIAGDLSSISSALLFGIPPKARIKAAHEDTQEPAPGTEESVQEMDAGNEPEVITDDQAVKLPLGDPAAKQTEARLQEILDKGGVYNRLLEAAESASAMGGVYLVPAWDQELSDVPLVIVAQADAAIPCFKLGRLHCVTFFREVDRVDNVVVRHLELHEPVPGGNSHILNALYRGSENQIGARLRDSDLVSITGLEPLVELPFPELDVEYIPNMRPNKLWRSSSLGLSDYSGSELLFDALDETYASWVRDIRLAKARIIVPKEFIDEFGAFDVDHEVFTKVNMEPATASGNLPILAQQFQIRHAEHLATALELVERIVSNAGYSPQTYGLHIMGRAESGTALRMRENRTMMTMARKSSWWAPALERLFSHLLLIDISIFNSKIEPAEVDVELSDSMVRDPSELAATVNILKQAEAASIQERVRMVQPDWTPEEVAAEVKRIQDETAAPAGPDPFALKSGPFSSKPMPADGAPTPPGAPPVMPGAPPSVPPAPAPTPVAGPPAFLKK